MCVGNSRLKSLQGENINYVRAFEKKKKEIIKGKKKEEQFTNVISAVRSF